MSAAASSWYRWAWIGLGGAAAATSIYYLYRRQNQPMLPPTEADNAKSLNRQLALRPKPEESAAMALPERDRAAASLAPRTPYNYAESVDGAMGRLPRASLAFLWAYDNHLRLCGRKTASELPLSADVWKDRMDAALSLLTVPERAVSLRFGTSTLTYGASDFLSRADMSMAALPLYRRWCRNKLALESMSFLIIGSGMVRCSSRAFSSEHAI
jgi:hypothetical protein